ncbi:MAG: fluoride efflux transporter CrcB [Verrucomicrobiaceae bacterium]|nr:fluoride efflux transporter CrcB [Verrucomicrobiaceae bacterium]
MTPYLLVFLGSGLGGALRYGITALITRWHGGPFPLGTLAVNVLGSFVIGFFATHTGPDGRWLVPQAGRTFFMAGLCGGFTTFSSFSLQTLDLMQRESWLHAGGNIAASVLLCLTAVWLGHCLALLLNR